MTAKEIIKKWSNEAEFPLLNPIPTIIFNVSKDKIVILTDRPGALIGYHGSLFYKYRDIFEENGFPREIEFIDLFMKRFVEIDFDGGCVVEK